MRSSLTGWMFVTNTQLVTHKKNEPVKIRFIPIYTTLFSSLPYYSLSLLIYLYPLPLPQQA
jgi:hypothetical protein